MRGEVWQLLAGSVGEETEMINTYRLLLTQESSCERVILNDLNRTFPAHEYFKEAGGLGQEALYKLSRVSSRAPRLSSYRLTNRINYLFSLSKAYSVRDKEVGYCQGLSFVIATLLIHVKRRNSIDRQSKKFLLSRSNLQDA